ncbi:MAG: DegT/DnrJ/EryC1/StrS family aminotransferase [Candidatus Sumerlaeaceae bacterium]
MRKLPAIGGGTPAKTTPFTREQRYGEPELQHLREALEQNTLFYAHGKKVRELEGVIAGMYGVPHVVACSSGTSSIHTAMIAAGISPGDEVITSPITDAGSVIPILWQGAIPVFADVHPTRHVITPDYVRAVLTDRTRAVLAVHLWGNACEVDALRALCDQRGIVLIEDCAQAWGTTYKARLVGTYGHYGCLSLNEYKHISCGDGGLVLCNSDEDAHRARLATDKGYSRTGDQRDRNPTFLANNYRMTELQAAVALGQVPKLNAIIARRRSWCDRLAAALCELPGLVLPDVTPGCESSWWFYMFRVHAEALGANVDKIAEALQAEGIPVMAHYIGRCVYEYPLMLNHSPFARGDHSFGSRNYGPGICPVAENLLQNCIVLPIHEGFTDVDLEETITAFRRVVEFFTEKRIV